MSAGPAAWDSLPRPFGPWGRRQPARWPMHFGRAALPSRGWGGRKLGSTYCAMTSNWRLWQAAISPPHRFRHFCPQACWTQGMDSGGNLLPGAANERAIDDGMFGCQGLAGQRSGRCPVMLQFVSDVAYLTSPVCLPCVDCTRKCRHSRYETWIKPMCPPLSMSDKVPGRGDHQLRWARSEMASGRSSIRRATC